MGFFNSGLGVYLKLIVVISLPMLGIAWILGDWTNINQLKPFADGMISGLALIFGMFAVAGICQWVKKLF